MRTQKIFLTAAITALILSCGKKEAEPKPKADPEADRAEMVSDSIEKAEKAEAELIRQDSIDASEIKGYNIKLVEGKHKYSDEKTKVEYRSLYTEIEDMKKQAAKEMWTEEKLKTTVDAYKKSAKGGVISIRIDRLTIESANPEMLTVIVKDSQDKEISREEMRSSVADHSSSTDMWYNFTTSFIPYRVKAPFFIYVVDKLQDVPLKYEVTPKK